MVCCLVLSLILNSNNFHSALCRPRPPSPRSLPSACLGHPHPRHPGPAGLCRGGHFHRHCDDQQQQEEGSQGQGSCKEEDLSGARQRDPTRRIRGSTRLACEGRVLPLVHTQSFQLSRLVSSNRTRERSFPDRTFPAIRPREQALGDEGDTTSRTPPARDPLGMPPRSTNEKRVRVTVQGWQAEQAP